MQQVLPNEVPQVLADYQDGLASGETVNVHVSRQRKKPLSPFVLLFCENLDAIVTQYSLTTFDFRLLVRLLTKMQYGNQIAIKQTALADELGVPRQQVSRGFKKFKEQGIIVVDDHGHEFFNIELALKGTVDDLHRDYSPQYELSRTASRERQHKVQDVLQRKAKAKPEQKPKRPRGRPPKQPDLFKATLVAPAVDAFEEAEA